MTREHEGKRGEGKEERKKGEGEKGEERKKKRRKKKLLVWEPVTSHSATHRHYSLATASRFTIYSEFPVPEKK